MKNNILKIINEKYEKYSIGYSKIKCPKFEQIAVRHSDSVAAIQVVQVVRCTRAHDSWGPTSKDQIAISKKNIFFLFFTLPVTVATAERSFSKLKSIKTYLRMIMQDDRLSGLAVLSIENAEARKLDVSKIIYDFASRKARRRKF